MLCQNRLAALISLLLFATSPTLILWSPEPSSRLIGLPNLLGGLACLIQIDGRFALLASVAISCCYFSADRYLGWPNRYKPRPCIHSRRYVWSSGWPGCARRRDRRYWVGLISFSIGLGWLHILVELVSHFGAGVPWDKGPTAMLFAVRTMHLSPFPPLEHLAMWSEWYKSQIGAPLLFGIAAGWVLCAREWRAGVATVMSTAYGC